VSPEIRFGAALVDSGPGATLLQAMRGEIAALYDGLALDGEHMPKAGRAELSPPHGAFLVGLLRAEAVCCGGVKRLQEGICEIKRMYVVPSWRGRGVGRLLLGALELKAQELGYDTARLDTGSRQPGARVLYETAGYRPIANFNGNPVATFFGEKSLS